jgi:hypothetical protein
METFKATIKRGESSTQLTLTVRGKALDIILTEDRPTDVKQAFNKLLEELKKGEFSFELKDTTEDLYHHISKEYIKQLNAELGIIYAELKDFDLLTKK